MKYYFLICILNNSRVSQIINCYGTYRFRENRIIKYYLLFVSLRTVGWVELLNVLNKGRPTECSEIYLFKL